MVRCGLNFLFNINSVVVLAISASVPTPVALSLAPGSCTCALKTKRSLGFDAPLALATIVSSPDA